MKKPTLPLLVPLIGIFAFCLFANLECNEESKQDDPTPQEPDKCGAEVTRNKSWGQGYLSPMTHYYGVDEGWAIYSYSVPSVNDVCAHKHVKVTFTIAYLMEYGADILYEAEVLYGVFYTYPVKDWKTLHDGNIVEAVAEADVGMYSPYGDDPGYFYPFMTVKVRDQGSDDKNHDYFLELMRWIQIDYIYYKWKDNSGG